MEKLRNFYRKYLKNYLVLLFVIAVGIDLVIETLARHSLIQSMAFLFGHPLVSISNVLLIFAIISLSMLFRRRIFALVLLGMIPMAVGIANGVILSNRMTPFTVKDFSNLKDGAAIITTYFSTVTLILAIVGIALLVFGGVILFRKAPKLDRKIQYKQVIAVILIIGLLTVGVIKINTKTGVLDTFFANLATGYSDNGVVYSFMVTWIDTGIDKPKDYSKEEIEGIFSKGELGEDNIYTPGKDDDTDVKSKPNIIYLQLESFIDPTRVKDVKFSKDPVPNFRKLMKEYSSGYLTVPAVGAGTANVEFEVMTGISAKFFGPGEYPYKSVLTEKTCEAAPYDFKQLGYGTHAIHNHRGAFYNRNKVFANMGFDTFTCLEYMNNVMKTPKNWAKDSLLTEQILDALNSTEGSDYIYTISVQGHGAYPDFEYYCS
ncbi:MAG: LTA synthase family protein, partial [Clostridia bacterium]